MTVLTRAQLYERRDETRAEEDRLRNQRDELLARAQADDALTDPGVKEKLDRLTTGIDRAHKQALEAGRAVVTELMNDPASADVGTDEQLHRVQHTNPSSPTRQQALRANDRADRVPEAGREHMERQIREDEDPEGRLARGVVALSDPDYTSAFYKWFRDTASGGHEWTDREREAVQRVRWLERAGMVISTGGSGGFLVPYELDNTILLAGVGAISPLRQLGRVAASSSNEKRFVTSLGVQPSWDPETTEVSDDTPALLQPAIVCKKGAAFVPVSYELLADSDIAQQLQNVFSDAKNVWESLSFTITQANGPNGIITALVAAGGGTVIATGTNVLAQADLYANQAALPARWRPNAKWMMNLSIINGFRQLPQAAGLNYSIISDTTTPPTALGWQVYENSSMDGSLTGAAADYSVLSGDFKQFAIVDRLGSQLVQIPALFGATLRPTAQAGFYYMWRTGSDVLIPDAFRLSNYST